VSRWKAVGEIEDNEEEEAGGGEFKVSSIGEEEGGLFVRSGVEGVDLEW